MNKNNRVKIIPRLLGMLLCLVLIQAACAQPGNSDKESTFGNVNYENGTYENVTDGNISGENVTVHTIYPTYYYTPLISGNSEKLTVSFENEGNETLNVTPKLVDSVYTSDNFNESWITISPTNATLEPVTIQEFTVEVNVPEDAESTYYQTAIAFTDDLLPDSTGYVNSMILDIPIQASPKLEVQTNKLEVQTNKLEVQTNKLEVQTNSLSDTVEAGKEYEYNIKIRNVADKDIPIDPKATSYAYAVSSNTFALSDDAIVISAPSVIKAGEITNMTIKVPVPENATGSYSGNIEMNVGGKANDGSSPQISLYLTTVQKPTVPYVKTFNTTSNVPITIEVSTDYYDQTMGLRTLPKIEEPSLNVNLKSNSHPVKMSLTKTTQSMSVNTGGYYFPVWSMNNNTIYQNYGMHYVETYTVKGATGNWELLIMPKNTNNFGYSINVGESK